jgi:hypothetical protein
LFSSAAKIEQPSNDMAFYAHEAKQHIQNMDLSFCHSLHRPILMFGSSNCKLSYFFSMNISLESFVVVQFQSQLSSSFDHGVIKGTTTKVNSCGLVRTYVSTSLTCSDLYLVENGLQPMLLGDTGGSISATQIFSDCALAPGVSVDTIRTLPAIPEFSLIGVESCDSFFELAPCTSNWRSFVWCLLISSIVRFALSSPLIRKEKGRIFLNKVS